MNQKDEAPGLAGAEGFWNQVKVNSTDSEGSQRDKQDTGGRLALIRAALAREGFALLDAPHSKRDAFTVTRWGMSTDLHDIAAVERFARRVGVIA